MKKKKVTYKDISYKQAKKLAKEMKESGDKNIAIILVRKTEKGEGRYVVYSKPKYQQ